MLTEPSWPDGYGHVSYGEVTSTLDVARDTAGQNLGPTWFTATRQTAARGRRGRAWIEPEGNFAATLSLPVASANEAAHRSFVAALALENALGVFLNLPDETTLKWPNDVLLNGHKVAGILLESLMFQNQFWGVSIGIGVNLAEAPKGDTLEAEAVPPISLAEVLGRPVSSDDFLLHLADAFARWEAAFQAGGFAQIRTAWLARAARLGEVITARTAQETHTGTFETIDEAGQLVLRTAKGQVLIAAADVFF